MKFVTLLRDGHRYAYPIPCLPSDTTTASPPTAISKLLEFYQPPLNKTFQFSIELQQLLNGRKLLLQEIPFPIHLIHDHYLNGYVSYNKSIKEDDGTYTCLRCGNTEKHLFAKYQCARCDEECTYCRHCITMGKVSQCSPLITWSGTPIQYPKQHRPLRWEGKLSPGQQQASEKIVQAVEKSLRLEGCKTVIGQQQEVPLVPNDVTKSEKKLNANVHCLTLHQLLLSIFNKQRQSQTVQQNKLLVWAVCGAGKTEILFEGMNRALELGQNVLIATPRSDVVHELTPRIKAVFPSTSVISLFGGSEDRGKQGQLVIATTHQLLRYENHFDFVVIDEVDAFPFSYDPMLKYAANQSAKPEATTILLTATPNKKLQKQVAKGTLDAVKIPKRYHGHPLPVPTVEWSGNWRKLLSKGLIPTNISEWLEKRMNSKQQAFLFVPSVAVLQKLVPILQTKYPSIEGVHSEDPDRRVKVQKFRNGDILILFTTTILERGVTVPNIAVAVYGADDDVFTESALVQISGRVGRSAEYPSGDIVFYHYGKTEAMLDAVDHIREMNKLGGFS